MYIAPSSSIEICRGVNLSPDYVNTVWFGTDSNAWARQYNYFHGFVPDNSYMLGQYSYVHYEQGILQVQMTTKQLLGCNYMIFRNTEFENKLFYAFITKVEYVNNESSRIYFELDVMQSWAFSYELPMCFVEREHAADDTIGANTVPEGLEIGELICTATKNLIFENYSITMIFSEKLDDEALSNLYEGGTQVLGIPFPLWFYDIELTADDTEDNRKIKISNIRQFTNLYSKQGKSDAIVGIFIRPKIFEDIFSGFSRTFSVANKTLSATAKNNKLYTYPYTECVVNTENDSVTLKYEFLNSLNLIYTTSTPANAVVTAFPEKYRGKNDCIELSVNVKNFPVIPWVTDYFQNWWAQNKGQYNSSLVRGYGKAISTVLQGGVNAALGNLSSFVSNIDAAIDSGSNISKILAEKEKHEIMPDTMNGSITGSANFYAINKLGIYTSCYSLKPEYVKIIDEYFTKFGYATHRVKVPNRDVRERWCYTKTVGMAIKNANIPAQDIVKINRIYDNGITFWKPTATIGDYSASNNTL